MKTDSVYVILWYKVKKDKKPKPRLHDLVVYKKKSDALKKLKDIVKEKVEEKSDYWKDGPDAYGYIDGENNSYYIWVQEVDLK